MSDEERSERYEPSEIEPRWQAQWAEDGLYHSNVEPGRPKHYALTMLPYPSGDLHIGHWYSSVPPDARARFKRMQGANVLFPIGFDAFGLPAENAAIKHNIHPKQWTYANIERMRGQLRLMGAMFDWRREMVSCDPEYYRWTQWFFLKLYGAGLAYRNAAAVDWCPSCNTTLAREQVIGDDRHCERCGTPVTRRNLEQWFFRTTRYAEELLDYTGLDWPERVRTLQSRWIGRSEGAQVTFKTESGASIDVFTTRPDTLWGATFLVLAPEHARVAEVTTPERRAEVEAYLEQAKRQSDVQREAADREKTAVATGGYAINPASGERIPIWVADYVLVTYGTGAIMAVPAHDERDFEVGQKYGLALQVVIQDESTLPPDAITLPNTGKGIMINSGPLTGTPRAEAFDKTVAYLEERGTGRRMVSYRLRDWLISRQRYWGTPIPMVYCDSCGVQPVPESDLPVTLPDDVDWRPTGESPLKLHPTWSQVACPKCGAMARRETDTMDTFMCSSWYHLRYLSPHDSEAAFDATEYGYWMPVDTYTGGIEHATMHLIYTRFFHKACRDMGITQGPEPMIQLHNQGIILGEDSEKMSKSRGNVVAPDALVERYGADTVRAFLMFFARWEQGGPWSPTGIEGTARWLRRVWTLVTDTPPATTAADEATLRQLRRKVHQTLRQVTRDFETFGFNTVVSALMELSNEMIKAAQGGAAGSTEWAEAVDVYLRMLAPVAPHLAEELWQRTGKPYSIHQQSWPAVDEAAAVDEEVTLVIQVNGKVRDRLVLPAGTGEEEAKALALASPLTQKFLEGREPKKVIVVPGRLINIVG